MKVRASIKKRSADCKIVRRKGKLYIINKKNKENKIKEITRLEFAQKMKLVNEKRQRGRNRKKWIKNSEKLMS